MTQTLALLLDAYRDLNARKMFWIVLIISFLVAGSFLAVGLTPTGLSFFGWHIDSFVNSRLVTPAIFYKGLFVSLGVDWWLAFLATFLALISTAGIFPDFIVSGAIDLYLSKPIGRLRLFLTKYIGALLFVALQTGCFCGAVFLVIGIRGGAWEPGVFLGVPIVVLFYSYLYCVSVLVGVVTRSALAAVLLTLLFWALVFGIHGSEMGTLMMTISDQRTVDRLDQRIAATESALHRQEQLAATQPAATRRAADIERLQTSLQQAREQRARIHGTWERAHRIIYDFKIALPKTSETIALLSRELIQRANLPQNQSDDSDQAATMQEFQQEVNSRSWGWIVGTSIGFECVMLALAAWIFCRRDY